MSYHRYTVPQIRERFLRHEISACNTCTNATWHSLCDVFISHWQTIWDILFDSNPERFHYKGSQTCYEWYGKAKLYETWREGPSCFQDCRKRKTGWESGGGGIGLLWLLKQERHSYNKGGDSGSTIAIIHTKANRIGAADPYHQTEGAFQRRGEFEPPANSVEAPEDWLKHMNTLQVQQMGSWGKEGKTAWWAAEERR